MPAELRIENLCKTFTKGREVVNAVRDVNLTVAEGELVTFLGPSGCGKTTILRMVAGFETPSGGTIHVGDEDITTLPVHSRGIGFVFQNYALFPHMSIFENVAYGLKARGEAEDAIGRGVAEALELVGLAGVERRFPNQLSGGEQQRVALARVLVLRPKLLLMDEPLSNLDAKLRLHMRTEIRRIQQHLGITCLYVTHDQKEALTMSDRIMVLSKGHVEQIGTPFELYAEPQTLFVADFIGQANVLPATIGEPAGGMAVTRLGPATLSLRCIAGSGTPAAGPASVVLRPENIRPVAAGEGKLPARVLHRFFVGDHMDYELTIDDMKLPKPLFASVPYEPGLALFEPGNTVGLDFAEKAAIVLFQTPGG
ncbi:MAG: ABC transporter ATP-binding protein [Methylobacteriaceae bacterium]|jgi:iron(III) transport system ATP-binding protein|nr:ABC transporter ATP-binding protein [Methylobacteriaceae bacterium]